MCGGAENVNQSTNTSNFHSPRPHREGTSLRFESIRHVLLTAHRLWGRSSSVSELIVLSSPESLALHVPSSYRHSRSQVALSFPDFPTASSPRGSCVRHTCDGLAILLKRSVISFRNSPLVLIGLTTESLLPSYLHRFHSCRDRDEEWSIATPLRHRSVLFHTGDCRAPKSVQISLLSVNGARLIRHLS